LAWFQRGQNPGEKALWEKIGFKSLLEIFYKLSVFSFD